MQWGAHTLLRETQQGPEAEKPGQAPAQLPAVSIPSSTGLQTSETQSQLLS